MLVEVLEQLDEMIGASRDRMRFVVKERRQRTVDTLLGPVTFRRRYYQDREQGVYVALLDEELGLQKQERVSPGLTVAAVFQAVLGPSYRAAQESLHRFFDQPVLSHESIRQRVLATGKRIGQEQQRRRDDPQGERRVPVLFLEVDGVHVSLQQEKKKNRELPVILSHEGWAKKGSGRELVGCHFYGQTRIKDFWEEASRHVWSHYQLDENTLVVINGDRASWIRQGVDYFPRAIYQADAFHVKREVRTNIRDPEQREAALRAYAQNQPQKLERILRQAAAEELVDTRGEALEDLARDIRRNPESFRDYRVRMQEQGYATEGLGGVGAAESLVKRLSYRLKNRGQSWRIEGVGKMLNSLVQRLEGNLAHYAEQVDRLRHHMEEARIQAGVGRLVKGAVDYAMGPQRGHVPAREMGRSGSGGLSRLMRRLDEGGMPVS